MKVLFRILCLMSLFTFIQVSVAAGLTVRFEPDSVNVGAPGTTFNVNIVIQDVADLGGFEFSVNYNPAIVTIADKSQVTLGAFLGSTVGPPLLLILPLIILRARLPLALSLLAPPMAQAYPELHWAFWQLLLSRFKARQMGFLI